MSTNDESPFRGTAKVRLHLDGDVHEIEVDSDSTVLDAALDAGLDPPYSCMAAACTTCMAKLVRGEVWMEDSEVLTDEEKASGYILCCQSHPRSGELDIEYED